MAIIRAVITYTLMQTPLSVPVISVDCRQASCKQSNVPYVWFLNQHEYLNTKGKNVSYASVQEAPKASDGTYLVKAGNHRGPSTADKPDGKEPTEVSTDMATPPPSSKKMKSQQKTRISLSIIYYTSVWVQSGQYKLICLKGSQVPRAHLLSGVTLKLQ